MYNVYCDGACLHNQKSRGCGGYGYVIVNGKNVIENSGHIKNKTSNEMELIAVIAALKDVMKIAAGTTAVVQIITDSKYIIQNWQDNLARWIDNGWKTKKGKDVCNRLYWELLLEMAHKPAFVSMVWCKGHADNKFQNRADELAREGARGKRKMPEKAVG